ncbi:MAG TPA: hypothetical protein VJI12_04300 [archaeon]|nr:hypothetical protein [archaeon]
MRKEILAISILSVLFVAGCASQTSINDYNNSYKPPAGTPSLEVIRPANGDSIDSSIIGIKVNVTNFQLVDIAANRTNVENQGHIAYVLDGVREIKSVYKDYSMANVAAGTHTLTVELRNNDNTPLFPPVKKSVTVSVAG